MKLLTFENDQIVIYEVSYDAEKLDVLLNNVAAEYGYKRSLQEKVKDKECAYLYFREYCDDFEGDWEFIAAIQDKTKVHKGRKRVPKKGAPTRYLFRFTGIDYPETYYTIKKLFSQEKLDFRIFIKYLYPEIGAVFNNIEYYIEEGYRQYDKNALEQLKKDLKDENFRKKHIEEVIIKRQTQRKCLESFYETLTIEPLDNTLIIMDKLQMQKYQMLNLGLSLSKYMPCGLYGQSHSENVIKVIPSDIELAKANTFMLNQMGGHFDVGKVKLLSK